MMELTTHYKLVADLTIHKIGEDFYFLNPTVVLCRLWRISDRLGF